MIDLHYWPTPNGHKVTMFLEETGLPYRIVPVDIGRGEQFKPEFLTIAPNNRMPAIVDHEPADGGAAGLGVRIRRHPALSRRQDRPVHRPPTCAAASRCCSGCSGRWAASGPMAGQNHHFAQLRAGEAALRDRPLRQRDQPALRRARPPPGRPRRSWPATTTRSPTWRPIRGSCRYERQGQNLDDFPNLKRWFDAIEARPATIRAYEIGERYQRREPTMNEEAKKVLFGQTAAVLKR